MTPLHSDDLSSERVRSGWTFISELRIMRCEEHCGLWLHSLIRLDEYTYWSTRVLHLQTNSRFTEYLLLFRWHRWRWPSRTKGWQRTTRTVRSSGSDLCFILIIYRTIVIMFPVNTQLSTLLPSASDGNIYILTDDKTSRCVRYIRYVVCGLL